MNPFPEDLEGKFVRKGKWELTKPFIYNSKIAGEIVVPIGFITDGSSQPPFTWIFLGSPWGGRFARGSVIHDWIYHDNTFTRKICDIVYLESMRILGVPLWKRRIMYRALRIFGGFCWKNKPLDKKESSIQT